MPRDALSASSSSSGGFHLRCPNGNYLSSLTIVREEHVSKLPTYHRRVPIPIDHMDGHGTCIPLRSGFFNGGRRVMVRCPVDDVDGTPSGITSWKPHSLSAATKPTAFLKPLQRCTFGVPRITAAHKEDGTSPGGDVHCQRCSKAHCACHDAVYDALSSVSRQRGSDSLSPALSDHSLQGRGAMRKFLEPLRHVRSHNLFQKLLYRSPSPATAGSTANLEGSLGEAPRMPCANDAVGDGGLGTSQQADQQQAHDDTGCAEGSLESTVASYNQAGDAKPSRNWVDKASVTDLNTALRVQSELDNFERREAERREREEFLRTSQSMSSIMLRR